MLSHLPVVVYSPVGQSRFYSAKAPFWKYWYSTGAMKVAFLLFGNRESRKTGEAEAKLKDTPLRKRKKQGCQGL